MSREAKAQASGVRHLKEGSSTSPALRLQCGLPGKQWKVSRPSELQRGLVSPETLQQGLFAVASHGPEPWGVQRGTGCCTCPPLQLAVHMVTSLTVARQAGRRRGGGCPHAHTSRTSSSEGWGCWVWNKTSPPGSRQVWTPLIHGRSSRWRTGLTSLLAVRVFLAPAVQGGWRGQRDLWQDTTSVLEQLQDQGLQPVCNYLNSTAGLSARQLAGQACKQP